MDNLIDKLKLNKNYFSGIVSNPTDTEILTKRNWDWLFFNKETIKELTIGYNVHEYKNNKTLLLAPAEDEGLFIDVKQNYVYMSGISSMYDSNNEKKITQSLDSIVKHFDILDDYL